MSKTPLYTFGTAVALALPGLAAPYVLPSPQTGALTPYDWHPMYGIESIYGISTNDMPNTWGVRGSFNLYSNAENRWRHQFSLQGAYLEGSDDVVLHHSRRHADQKIWSVPMTAGYDLNFGLVDKLFLDIGGKAGYALGQYRLKDNHARRRYEDSFGAFTFSVGAALKVQAGESIMVKLGYEYARTYIHTEYARSFSQHVISLGVSSVF